MVLEVAEGLQYMSADERLAHQITTTHWVSSPTSPAVVAYDENDGSDVTSTVYPTNSPFVNGDVISLSLLRDLSVGHAYRIEVKFTVGSNIYECYFRVKCEI
ncbi:hypothetical protein LCGC14_0567210 [marine sediment metagenome]|uniref:Uncharacterized protein n=1 Tax=marine sediment metagenome TaxID=412755 RepID=A0A0F9RQG4_9ZZZZ